MKKLLILALSLCTFLGFAQQNNPEKKKALMERLTKSRTPQERAEIQAKQLTLKLDLSEQQQTQVLDILTSHYAEGEGKIDANKKNRKEMSDDDRHKMQTERLDAQIALKAKMKDILNDEQYAKYSQMMERQMKRRGGPGMKGKRN
ncbi:magnesium transporter CorA family protein [Winogradskyella jejuensis]|uniref:LTXXQ motif family protein n=1 Tax=Winogradskyella jejuensis TaxID=1089305 RepID=A0A1M5PN56_9FLAO|nr:hypothetical protein [Winogradskyella jejuensis]SHH03019.1 hypothetical protein SAMN05444148_1537 [Winogradskyella jejuensis]